MHCHTQLQPDKIHSGDGLFMIHASVPSDARMNDTLGRASMSSWLQEYSAAMG